MKIKSFVVMASLAMLTVYAPMSLSAGAGRSDDDVEMIGKPAPDSKFAKVHAGMYSKEISDLIGPPTDQKSYQTGKAFIPFHFGSDNYRTEYHYKGEGVLTFSGGGMGEMGSLKLIRIEANPSESGYIH
jgi:hypothetical protein